MKQIVAEEGMAQPDSQRTTTRIHILLLASSLLTPARGGRGIKRSSTVLTTCDLLIG